MLDRLRPENEILVVFKLFRGFSDFLLKLTFFMNGKTGLIDIVPHTVYGTINIWMGKKAAG